MTASHDDLQRSLGRVEGNQDAMEARMDRFESLVTDGFKKVEATLADLKREVGDLKTRESERKGAWATIVGIVSAISGIVGALFIKWMG